MALFVAIDLSNVPGKNVNESNTVKPEIVVFDLGKVLVDFDYSIAARRIGAKSRLTETEMSAYLAESPWLVRYETGLVGRKEFYEAIRTETGFSGTLEEFSEYFADIFTEIVPMTVLHAALRSRGVKTYIFSNTNDLAVEHIRARFPFFSGFDGYIYSYEVGAMKPMTPIYEALEKLTGRRAAQILYIDDREENIAAGAARGWHTILQTDPAITRDGVAKWGLLG